MERKSALPPLLGALLAGACIVVIVAGMKAAAPIVNMFFIAFLLAQSGVLLPVWLARRGLKPAMALVITIMAVIVGGTALIWLLGSSAADMMEKLPAYQQKLGGLRDGIVQFLAARGLDAERLADMDVMPPKEIIELAGSALGAVAGTLGHAFLLLFLTIFMLIEFVSVETKMERGAYPDGSPMHQVAMVSKDTRKYLGITGLVGFAQAVINTIALAVLGIDFAVTFGVLFFFCNFVPAVGFFIAVVPPVLIALLDHNWKRALIVLIAWWAINFLFDNILKPKFMKQGLDIPILHIIMGLIVWSWILGPVGAILAIPLTMIITRIAQSAGGPLFTTTSGGSAGTAGKDDE